MGGGLRGRRNSSEAQTDTLPSFASLRDRTDAAGKELQAPFQDETFKDETGSPHAQAVCLPLASSHILSVQHCASVSIATEEPKNAAAPGAAVQACGNGQRLREIEAAARNLEKTDTESLMTAAGSIGASAQSSWPCSAVRPRSPQKKRGELLSAALPCREATARGRLPDFRTAVGALNAET